MKKLVISIVIILLVFVGANFVLKNKNQYETKTPEASKETKEVTFLINPALYETKTNKQSAQGVEHNEVYPQFKNVPNEFNKKIEETVLGYFSAQVPGDDYTESPPEEYSPREKYEFNSSWTPVQVNESFISFLLRFGGYTGGAHGYSSLTSFNYDVKNQKEIALRDLFPSDPNYLKTISGYARKDLRLQFGKNVEEDMLLAGTELDEINFSVFTFTGDEITFYFNQYQVAPYSMGQFTVTMPRK
ncbi:hypothetical protein A2911_01600 [Candidatus Nomurabacteria bacterium RIFCSPLOWO2_01_FULL_40_15]|uniref:DUF3298 domain-containing protein n=1 Tax=Candidatus Nomurabacteria bacterium RIFCSPLOWO2_01_FULL_40_15 TaxID=1801772 RepID=A0A1F6X8Q2_9BACT|nr:MAG: hypothetical protein A2911_01600 [Candidatus Nomurabacteria bacterium RIFCSPLOWO2_01_FULL_40_15]